MKIWKPIFGFLYTLFYAVAAFLDLGFGHGTGIFLAPVFPLPWVLLMTALYLSTNASTQRKRLYFFLLMACHYAITFFGVVISWEGNKKGTMKMWNEQFNMFPITIGIYLIGQAVIWLAFIYRNQNQEIDNLA